jgi:hypothetical protein
MQRSLCLQETERPKAQQVEAAAEVVTDCELCVVDSPVYEMDRVCCCVRYLMHETRLEVRRAWLDWTKKKNRALGDKVEKEVSARWSMKKKK